MVLVDTSVIIDGLQKKNNSKTQLLNRLYETKTPFGISVYTYHEILQGAVNLSEFEELESYLQTQKIFFLPNTPQIYSQSSKLFFDLRRQGITIRNTIDVLIAFTAIYNQIPLLHNDRDFDYIAAKTPELQIFE
jgi:hypothetical protein